MSDDLKPKAVPVPPPGPGQIPADQLPGEGRPPMKTGKVYMSEYTRQQLTAVGWQEGDPIPGDLGQRLQEIQGEVMREKEEATLEGSTLAAGWKPPTTSIVDIESLPEAAQAEIREYLAEYKVEVAAQTQLSDAEAAVDASIPDSVQGHMRDVTKQQLMSGAAAMAEREAGKAGQGSTVIDDRVPAGAPPVPEGKTLGGVNMGEGVGAKIDELNRRKEEARHPPKPEAKPVPEPAPSAGFPQRAVGNCQRCAWPLEMEFEAQPSDGDKQSFIAAILGTSRFEKGYSLMDGNVKVKFRTLTTEETGLLNFQLSADIRNGQIRGDGEYLAWSIEYRLILSVSEVSVGGNIVAKVPPVIDWSREHPVTYKQNGKKPDSPPAETDDTAEAFTAFASGVHNNATPLPRMREWFYKECITQEPLRRCIGEQGRQFNRVVEALEVMTAEPSFWKGIELPA